MRSRCIICGKEFEDKVVNFKVKCPNCEYIRKLTKVACLQCQTIFGVVNRCHAICPNCGYVHSCSEAEVVE